MPDRAVPLEFTPELWGGDYDHPVVWQDIVTGKELTLDFNGDPSVARYRAYLYYPAPNNGEDLNFRPVAYLRGIFTRYFTYDAVADQLTEVTGQVSACDPAGYRFRPEVGGIIVSDAAGQYALGAYGASVAAGGSVTRFGVRPRICPEYGSYWENPESESSWSTVVLMQQYVGPITKEISTFDRYIVTNTLENVRNSMRKLYQAGMR